MSSHPPFQPQQPDLSRSEAFVEDLEDDAVPSPIVTRSFTTSTVALLSIAPLSLAVLGAVFGIGP